MKNEQHIPSQLIEQFLSGKLSASEEKKLLNWIDSTPNSFVLFQQEQERLRPLIAQKYREQITPQWKQLFHKLQSAPSTSRHLKKKLSKRFLYPAAAAILAIAIVLAATLYNKQPQSNDRQSAKMEEISTHYGERTSLILPDGTKVILNANSKIIYPDHFENNQREVKLYGEAFFEVTHNATKPFIVKTYGLNVRVLGTAFNLEAFPESNQINTTLVQGKVQLEKGNNKHPHPIAQMAPNDHATFDTNNQEVKIENKKNIDQYISWKDGKLVFMNSSIEEVAKKLELWYNVEVEVQGEELKKAHFTGTITNETIDQALNSFKISYPIDYKITRLNTNGETDKPVFHILLKYNK